MVNENKGNLERVTLEAVNLIRGEVLRLAATVESFPETSNGPTGRQEEGLVLYVEQLGSEMDGTYRSRYVMLTKIGISSFEEQLHFERDGSLSQRPATYREEERSSDYLVYGDQALKSLSRILEQQEHNH